MLICYIDMHHLTLGGDGWKWILFYFCRNDPPRYTTYTNANKMLTFLKSLYEKVFVCQTETHSDAHFHTKGLEITV